MQKKLLPLLVSQEKDRRLGFTIILLIANLTRLPEENQQNKDDLWMHIYRYREDFLSDQVL